MQGDQDVIDALNAGLTIELTAINQYFIQAKMCANWGYPRLAKHFYEESIEEMKHAEYLIDRILFLDGVPEIARYDVIRVGQTLKEQLDNSLQLELGGAKTYNEGIKLAADRKDNGSREVMERILKETEESVDWLEAQMHLIETTSIELYLATQGAGSGDED
ncbi:MAG: bacterioferritin [Planctomycetaceae bacterium]|nr:bacterioferritin [Planctomycetaceae bacterium]